MGALRRNAAPADAGKVNIIADKMLADPRIQRTRLPCSTVRRGSVFVGVTPAGAGA